MPSSLLEFEPHQENLLFADSKQGRRSTRVTAQLISAFIFTTYIVQSLYSRNFNPLAIFCESSAQFILDMVGNEKGRFSHDKPKRNRSSVFLISSDRNQSVEVLKKVLKILNTEPREIILSRQPIVILISLHGTAADLPVFHVFSKFHSGFVL